MCYSTSASPSLCLSGAGAGSTILLELGQTSTAFTAALIDKLVSPSYNGRAEYSEAGSSNPGSWLLVELLYNNSALKLHAVFMSHVQVCSPSTMREGILRTWDLIF